MRPFLILGLLAPFILSPAALAEEAIPTPTYERFMERCLMSASQKMGTQQKLAGAGLICQCAHERFARKPILTKSDLELGMDQCTASLAANPPGFMDEYGPRLRAGLRTLARSPASN